MKKKFVFIGYWPDYETLFIEHARHSAYEIVCVNPRQHLSQIINPHWLPKPLRSFCEKYIIRQQLKKYANDIFIFQETRIPLEVLRDTDLPVCAHILVRNIVDPQSKIGRCILSLTKKAYSVWSFDHADCERYGFKPYKQFISACPGISETKIHYDLSFVGRNKGREHLLQQLANTAAQQNLRCYLDIRSDGKSVTPGQTYRANISYLDYLSALCSAHCIIDIVQQNQSGLTMRPLEAMIYHRKLLTNNPTILDADFYHPNNILYFQNISELDQQRLSHFLNQPAVEIDPQIMQSYSLQHLLLKILSTSAQVDHHSSGPT